MLIKPITNEELDFCEAWFTPRCFIESLFHIFDNISQFSEDKFGILRLYQFPFLSDESLIDFDETAKYHNLKPYEKFQMRKRVGDIYCFGARSFGKTKIIEEMDLVNSAIHFDSEQTVFSSMDLDHLGRVLDKIGVFLSSHPIGKIFKGVKNKSAPKYDFLLKNGHQINSVNFDLGSKEQGKQWFGYHVPRIYIEEASKETQSVADKRKDSSAENGTVFRISGMTDFNKHSPAGKSFREPKNKPFLINYSQFVNPTWNKKKKQEKIKQYGGTDNPNYKIYVLGDVMQDKASEFNMQRIEKECYNRKKSIKRFELPLKRFHRFKEDIIVERPINAQRIFLCSDIGESSGSDMIILSEIGNKYHYLYNIIMYDLTHTEQSIVFKWLIEKLQVNVLGLDIGDGCGRAVCVEIEKFFPKQNMCKYAGASKLSVGFEKNHKGEVLLKNGEPVIRQEYMSEWSVHRLKTLLYEGRVEIPEDFKFEDQFANVISMKSGTRNVYDCISETGNHLFDGWKVFAIAQWLFKDFNQTKPIRKPWGTGVCSL